MSRQCKLQGRRLSTLPDNYRRYYNHLLDLMTTTVNSAHLNPWAKRYAGLLGQDWSGVVNYLQQRANFIRATMPLTTAFAITNNAGRSFATTNNPVSLAGSAPLTVNEIHVNFKLPQSGMTLGFFAANGTIQNTVTFGAQLGNVSQGLYPDGNTNAVYFFTNWSPRASNRLGSPPSPQLGAFVVQAGGMFAFQASTIPGRTYRVEFKDQLNAPTWTTVGTNLTATGLQITVSGHLGSTAQRFYRVMLVP